MIDQILLGYGGHLNSPPGPSKAFTPGQCAFLGKWDRLATVGFNTSFPSPAEVPTRTNIQARWALRPASCQHSPPLEGWSHCPKRQHAFHRQLPISFPPGEKRRRLGSPSHFPIFCRWNCFLFNSFQTSVACNSPDAGRTGVLAVARVCDRPVGMLFGCWVK